MKNNNFIITKNDIYIAQVVSFIGVEETRLIYKDLSSDEIFRKVLLKDKTLIDFKTGDIIYPLNIVDGVDESTIYKNHLYCINLMKPNIKQVSDNDLQYAVSLYDSFLNKKDLIKQKKLIIFPSTKLN